ncbi:MAG: hypothetical protein AAF518_09200 [Spirochaetota bacterium]
MSNDSPGFSNFKRFLFVLFQKTVLNISFILKILWLTCLYIFSTWLVLGTLTSQQFQEKVLNKVNPETKKNYSVSNLISLTEQYDAGLVRLKDLQIEVQKQEKKVMKLDKNLKKLRKQRDSIITQFQEISSRLSLEFKTVKSAWTALQGVLKAVGTEQLDLKSLQENIKRLERSANDHDEMIVRLVSETNNLVENQSSQRNAETQVIEAIQELVLAIQEHQKAQDLIKEVDDDHLKELLVELRYLTNLKFHYLATMPNQLLTLILTLSMGALGSTIFLTKELFNQSARNRALNWYLFRPFLGMVTAISIFVLVKSGQIVLTYNTSSEGVVSEALNPFFVSFLAIISGVLSEHAYEKIYKTGQSFFDFEEQQDIRWGVQLKREIEKQEKSIEELSKISQTPTQVIQEWVEETSPVPYAEQKVIAAWLGLPMRSLFTDLPPLPKNKPNQQSS